MTNQALPPAIQRQLEEAQALEKQLFGQPTPEAGNTEPDPAPATTPEPTAGVEPQVVQPDPVAQEELTFKRRFEVLQGKYDAEVPRLHAQLREATAKLNDAFAQIETIRSTPQTPAAPETDNDAETYGADLTEVIDRRATKRAEQLVESRMTSVMDYVKKLETQLGQVNQQVEVTVEDRFYSQLAESVPDYKAINTEDGFLQWLGEVDPVYGVPRQVALDAAAQRLDVTRVAAVFEAYKILTGKHGETQRTQQRNKELERQVAPNAPRSVAADKPTSEKVWSRTEYEHAYSPRTIRELGAEKAAELMREADRAVAEGRIRW